MTPQPPFAFDMVEPPPAYRSRWRESLRNVIVVLHDPVEVAITLSEFETARPLIQNERATAVIPRHDGALPAGAFA